MNELERLKKEAKELREWWEGGREGFQIGKFGGCLRALDRAIAIAERFEDAKLNWFTDCPSCCHLLDSNYELYVERDKARADVLVARQVVLRANVDDFLAFMADTEHYEQYR